MLKKIFYFSLIFSYSIASASSFDFILPHYVKVDKVIPIIEKQLISHNVEHCDFIQTKENIKCRENSIIIKKNLGGYSSQYISEFNEYHPEVSYFDENKGTCFHFIKEKKCHNIVQKDYLNVVVSYKNIAYSKGHTYISFSDEPKCFIKLKKNIF